MSRTKVALGADQIEALMRDAFGTRARVGGARAAEGGMYNAGYHIDLLGAGPARVFLKVAPPDEIEALTHERDLMRAEAATMARLAEAEIGCAPSILIADFSRRMIDRDYLVLEHRDGAPLSGIAPELTPQQIADVRGQIGRIAGRVRELTAPAFGYPHLGALQAPTWSAAFGRMVGAVLADARRFGVDLPRGGANLAAAFAGAGSLLDEVAIAELVHFDLWDGNILVRTGDDGPQVTGVIDWERAFYGDPLAELVCLAGFKAPDPGMAVMGGLAEARGGPVLLDDPALARLAVYRAYLWLIMIVESKPRGERDESWPARERALVARLEADLARFG
jgi:aminoglycoside phosphotransferase (APT) family kinase protein